MLRWLTGLLCFVLGTPIQSEERYLGTCHTFGLPSLNLPLMAVDPLIDRSRPSPISRLLGPPLARCDGGHRAFEGDVVRRWQPRIIHPSVAVLPLSAELVRGWSCCIVESIEDH